MLKKIKVFDAKKMLADYIKFNFPISSFKCACEWCFEQDGYRCVQNENGAWIIRCSGMEVHEDWLSDSVREVDDND